MAKSGVELDFFCMNKYTSAIPAQPKKLFDRRRSFRDIQSVISKLNPELLKSVIASGSVDQSLNISKSSESKVPFSVPSTLKRGENLFPALPVFKNSSCVSESTSETAPLTIFYNGTVTVFDVPRDKADNILKIAEGGFSDADLPIARRKSLQRFLEKRKERVILLSPYLQPVNHTSSH